MDVIQHYKATTKVIFDWMGDPEGATPKRLYRDLEAAGLLWTEAKREEARDEGYQAGREDAARSIERLRDLAMRDTTVDTDTEQVMADAYFGALDEAAAVARVGINGSSTDTGEAGDG